MRVNLTEYTSSADVISIRHLFEHNIEYDKIFDNALKSFNKLLIIVFFTKLNEYDNSIKYKYANKYPNWGNKKVEMADLYINKNYLKYVLNNNNFSQKYNEKKSYTFINNIGTNGNETILIIKK